MKEGTKIIDCRFESIGIFLVCHEPDDSTQMESRRFTWIKEGEQVFDSNRSRYLGKRPTDNKCLYEITNMDKINYQKNSIT